ncbi:hypothetical protein Taro_048552 [Colocasia esculenta]|uniref:Uncharacterized protein n=1 Tax=Colocasia esculenta TaxID=4460 RepID=A0A843X8F4_COLES|nr:hypothetical protein [Colocasia esculenta]
MSSSHTQPHPHLTALHPPAPYLGAFTRSPELRFQLPALHAPSPSCTPGLCTHRLTPELCTNCLQLHAQQLWILPASVDLGGKNKKNEVMCVANSGEEEGRAWCPGVVELAWSEKEVANRREGPYWGSFFVKALVDVVGLALGRPVLLVVSASVFSWFRDSVLRCQSVMAPACVASRPCSVSGVWGGSACGPSTLGRSEVAMLVESCVSPDLGWWSWRCAVRDCSSWLVLAEVRFPQNCVVLVSGYCGAALEVKVHRLVALCSGKSGALVVLVEVLPGPACVASTVLLAVVFTLMCVVRLGCVLVRFSQDDSCRFWGRFSPKLPGGECKLGGALVAFHVVVLEFGLFIGLDRGGASCSCAPGSCYGLRSLCRRVGAPCFGVLFGADVVVVLLKSLDFRVLPLWVSGEESPSVGPVLSATEWVADWLVPTVRSVGGCSRVVFGWRFLLFRPDLASLSTYGVVVPFGHPTCGWSEPLVSRLGAPAPVGVVGLALGRPVLLVVSASVFSRFCVSDHGCQSVMAPACVASQPCGVSGFRGSSSCGPSTLGRSEVCGDASFGS